MTTQLGQAYIAIRGDWDSFERDVDSEGQRRIQGPMARMASVAGGVFTGILATRAAGAAVDFFRGGIEGASDLNENLSRTAVTFGENQDRMVEFARTAATSMGQSQNAALNALNTFGGLFNTLGFGADQAADASLEYTQLASDLASFGNTSPEEAVEALGAALRGESEPIRRFNVLLDDATLRARAMAMGIYDGVGPLDANTRAQAAYAEILEQTSAAQGDFARTSEGAANQDRIRSAQMENLRTQVGQGLLPIYTELLRFTNDQLLPALMAFGQWWSEEGWPRVQVFMLGLREELLPVFNAVVAWVQENWPQIRATVVGVLDAISTVATAFIDAFLAAWNLWGDNILAFIEAVWPNVRDYIDAVLGQIRAVFEIFAGIFSGDWDRVWNGVKDLVANIWQQIVATVGIALDGLRLVLGAAWELIRNTAVSAWNGVKDGIGNVVATIVTEVGAKVLTIIGFFTDTLPDAIGALPSRFVGLGRDIGRALVNGLIGIWNMIDFNVPSFTVPGWVPGIGGNSFGGFDLFPDVAPIYHSGGFTTGSASDEYWARVRGQELVLPLDMPNRTAALLGQAGLAGGRPGISIDTVLVDQTVDFDDQMRRAELLYDLGLAS